MFQQTNHPARNSFRILVFLFLLLPFMAGCAFLDELGAEPDNNDNAAREIHPEPYNPSGFSDLLIPSELTWLRDKSMVVNTDSYAGGVLYFTGRVDVNSLADFFTTTMRRDGWELVGSVTHQDVLLAFIKPNKTCTIIIRNRGLVSPTDIQIHIADDLTKSRRGDASTPDEGGNGAPVAPVETAPFSF